MDHIRLTNALTKAGATITGEGDRFRATKGTREIRWYTQEDWQKPGRMEAICVRWPSPQTDSSTDCCTWRTSRVWLMAFRFRAYFGGEAKPGAPGAASAPTAHWSP